MEENRALIKQKLADIYDGSAQRYHAHHYVTPKRYSPLQYRQHYIETMIERQKLSRGSKILDVGCGPGELIVSLLRKGYDVCGVDISQRMVEEAVRTVRGNGFPDWDRGFVGDIEKLDFSDGAFDVVVASGVIEYQKDDHAALCEMSRVLKKGGLLIANVTNMYSYLRLFERMYAWLKQNKMVGAVTQVVSGSPSKGEDSEVPPVPTKRIHDPKVFDREIAAVGLEKVGYNYFHFSLVPKPLDSILEFFNEPVSKQMEALTNSSLATLGGGYLVIARKIGSFR